MSELERLASLSPEELEAENAERMEALRSAVDEAASLSPAEEDALAILSDPEGDELVDVELRNGVSVSVRTTLPGYVEDMVDTITDADSFREVRFLIAEALGAIIVDEAYGSAKVWRAYGDRNGTTSLAEMFEKCLSPALDRREAVDGFRPER